MEYWDQGWGIKVNPSKRQEELRRYSKYEKKLLNYYSFDSKINKFYFAQPYIISIINN